MEIRRRILEGEVISSKMDKTVVVKVLRVKKNLLYKKTFNVFKKFKVHDENNKYKVGDKVRIIESKPYSKEKKYKVLEEVDIKRDNN